MMHLANPVATAGRTRLLDYIHERRSGSADGAKPRAVAPLSLSASLGPSGMSETEPVGNELLITCAGITDLNNHTWHKRITFAEER